MSEKKSRNRYSDVYKAEAVRLLNDSGHRHADCARTWGQCRCAASVGSGGARGQSSWENAHGRESRARGTGAIAPRTCASHAGTGFFKTCGGVLCEGPQMKYRTIRDNAGRFAVSLMCSALQVSASGSYAWLDRPRSARAQANRRLPDQIRNAHQRSRSTYGSPRITHELRAEGHCVGENHVAGLMRAAQIRTKSARKWHATTQSSHRLPVAENTLDRGLTSLSPIACGPGISAMYGWLKVGCIWRWCWICTRARSSAGRWASD